jgi:hypothetical protein
VAPATLDDLGWEPEPDADEFTLTMDGVDLSHGWSRT